jgi:hypothetical protein
MLVILAAVIAGVLLEVGARLGWAFREWREKCAAWQRQQDAEELRLQLLLAGMQRQNRQ